MHMQAAQVDEEEAEEPEEASCMVCKEGYKGAPGKLLGCYVYCKRVAARSCPEATAPGTDPDLMVRGCGARALTVQEQSQYSCRKHCSLQRSATFSSCPLSPIVLLTMPEPREPELNIHCWQAQSNVSCFPSPQVL